MHTLPRPHILLTPDYLPTKEQVEADLARAEAAFERLVKFVERNS